jgi:hypothetical protein
MPVSEARQTIEASAKSIGKSAYFFIRRLIFFRLSVLEGTISMTDFKTKSNAVSLIESQAGIRFGKYGIAYTDPIEELREKNGLGGNGFSIEITLKPLDNEEGFNFILALHNGNDRSQLLLGQWRSWNIAMNEDDYDHLYVPDPEWFVSYT